MKNIKGKQNKDGSWRVKIENLNKAGLTNIKVGSYIVNDKEVYLCYKESNRSVWFETVVDPEEIIWPGNIPNYGPIKVILALIIFAIALSLA